MSNQIAEDKFDVLLKVCIIIGIIVVSGFILYYILTPEPGYITFGILNENQEAENYPTEASINESISFYLTVENQLTDELSFSIKIKKGNNDTILSPRGSNGILEFMINDTLSFSNTWISNKINVSFSQLGANQIIIAELWQIDNNELETFFDILWLRLNITS
ncbi:MAG: DUF1616 domain-containing protein [Candidatus Lokiarchaeota archaeon]|nr:DUF1616 domain-containing protein [Candidatus Lokiarchaeota archaeon]